MLRLIEEDQSIEVWWIVLSAVAERAHKAEASARAFTVGLTSPKLIVKEFRDGFFPSLGHEVKEFFEEVRRSFSPDLIFSTTAMTSTRIIGSLSELTWNTFRDQLILVRGIEARSATNFADAFYGRKAVI